METKDNASIFCDLGSGDGAFIKLIQDDFPNSRIVGLDLDKSKIREASANDNVDFIVADVHFIPLQQSSCDIVTCLEVVEHINNFASFFNEIERVMKPEGTFVISTPNIRSFSAITASFVYAVLGKKYKAFDETHVNLYRPERIMKRLETFSFHDFRLSGFWLLPSGLSWSPLLSALTTNGRLVRLLSKSFSNKFLVKLAFITIVKCRRGS